MRTAAYAGCYSCFWLDKESIHSFSLQCFPIGQKGLILCHVIAHCCIHQSDNDFEWPVGCSVFWVFFWLRWRVYKLLWDLTWSVTFWRLHLQLSSLSPCSIVFSALWQGLSIYTFFTYWQLFITCYLLYFSLAVTTRRIKLRFCRVLVARAKFVLYSFSSLLSNTKFWTSKY